MSRIRWARPAVTPPARPRGDGHGQSHPTTESGATRGHGDAAPDSRDGSVDTGGSPGEAGVRLSGRGGEGEATATHDPGAAPGPQDISREPPTVDELLDLLAAIHDAMARQWDHIGADSRAVRTAIGIEVRIATEFAIAGYNPAAVAAELRRQVARRLAD